jgi:coiled-coil domain-containing protein 132
MDNVKWDIKDIPTLHNSYVDSLLRELQLFSIRLEQIYLDLKVHVPIATKEMIWCLVLKLANRIFIEGFSMAKKCTPAGRASMQLDFQQFLSKVQKVYSTKTIPEKELVEEYIKAYYLMDEALEQWIIKRNEYTYKQLLSLINCVVSEKKVKNRLLTIIESKFDQNSNSDLPH